MQLLKKIGTHSGKFHADDVTAVMLLLNFLPTYSNAKLTRTRDMDVLSTMDIVVDVGGEYNPQTNRFDHHQKEFEETYSESYDIRLSASGLVFKHYGIEIIKNALSYLFNTDVNVAKYKIEMEEKSLVEFKDKLYDSFFVCLDGIDNGISRYPADVEPRYNSNNTNLGSRINKLNKNWWMEEGPSQDERFVMAMELAKEDFLAAVTGLYFSVFVVKDIVKGFIEERFTVHESGKIIHLRRSVGWKRALLELETELGIEGELKLVIFENPGGDYRVQSVPMSDGSFENRAPLLKEWRGLELGKLKEISKIDDIVFVHHSGFIGGAQSFESALKMAVLTLESL